AAQTARNQLQRWDDDATIKQLYESGAMPATVYAIFDGSNSYGELDAEIKQEWASMSIAERKTVLDNLAQELADKYDIEVPPVNFDEDMGELSLGRWHE